MDTEAMKEQQNRLREEYDGKLAEIERERETIEEEKAQVGVNVVSGVSLYLGGVLNA